MAGPTFHTTSPACRAWSSEIDERLAQLSSALHELRAMDSVDAEAAGQLFAALGEIPSQLVDAVTERRLDPAVAADVALLVDELQDQLRGHVRISRSQTFERIQDVLVAVSREAGTDELIERAPAALCAACGFERASISLLRGSAWVPEVIHDTAWAQDAESTYRDALLRDLEVPLKPGLWETELVRRRVPVLVADTHDDPKSFGPFIRRAGTRSYVAAPIIVDDRVFGLLHADNITPGRRLSTADRDNVRIFADGFALVYERVALAESVQRQRQRLAEVFSTAGSVAESVLGDLDVAAVRLAKSQTGATVGPATVVGPTTPAGRGDGLLTSREREILALLATGATNLSIAARLFVSESTVKSHVKRILRKLPAANRAEAVYRYTQMISGQDEPS